MHIRISLGTKYHFKQTVLNFCTKFAQKEYFWSKKEKKKRKENDHWILHIQVSLGTKFQLKLTILLFWTKFAQKEYFRSKTEKVNIIIEFCIFELI